MSRDTKLKIAALATALVTSLGTVAVSATAGVVDAGGKDSKRDGSWCC